MAKSDWSSGTLPDVPPQLQEARDRTLEALVAAEKSELAARQLRRLASAELESFKAALEELVTDPLFEIHGGD